MKKIIAIAALLGLGFGLTACGPSAPSSQEEGQQQTEAAFDAQSHAVPYPADKLKDSLERRNIRERLLRTNKPDALSYLYLMSQLGQPLGYYTIKGKVSSTQSQMTTSTRVEHHGDAGGGNLAYEAPGDDGSYGANEDGVFFFTTEGAMVTTNLPYVVSDQPIPFNVKKLG